ncbi:MAG: hypothetical protein MZU97_07125 [Bacillus subtilis]|nr:hypothetical protein [Bacillus subtilis]
MLLAAGGMPAHATINVVTTLPDLADFVRIAGGDLVQVDNIVRGDQNPHYIEVKPSYMMKLRARPDLLHGRDGSGEMGAADYRRVPEHFAGGSGPFPEDNEA